jgi:hypothetical protein
MPATWSSGWRFCFLIRRSRVHPSSILLRDISPPHQGKWRGGRTRPDSCLIFYSALHNVNNWSSIVKYVSNQVSTQSLFLASCLQHTLSNWTNEQWGMKSTSFRDITLCSPLKVNGDLAGKISPPSLGSKPRDQCESRWYSSHKTMRYSVRWGSWNSQHGVCHGSIRLHRTEVTF